MMHSTAEMVSFVVSGMGVPATQFIPIIIGGSVMFGSVLGVMTLGEVVMLHGWSGVAMLCVGIVMVATDPGEKVEEGGGSEAESDEPPLALWIGLLCSALLRTQCITYALKRDHLPSTLSLAPSHFNLLPPSTEPAFWELCTSTVFAHNMTGEESCGLAGRDYLLV